MAEPICGPGPPPTCFRALAARKRGAANAGSDSPRIDWPTSPDSVTMLALPRIIGHRGAAALAPENTLAGFRRAAAEGIAWVEFDARLAADAPVVLHDATLDRTTDASGPVRARPIASLTDVDAGRRFGGAFIGERLPTLTEALIEIDRLGLGANLELKADPGSEAELVQAVAEIAHEAGRALRGRLLLSSFSVPVLVALRDVVPEIPRGLLVEALPPDWEGLARRLGCISIHADHRRLAPGGAAAVK